MNAQELLDATVLKDTESALRSAKQIVDRIAQRRRGTYVSTEDDRFKQPTIFVDICWWWQTVVSVVKEWNV